ncbi:hypothetical protein C1645_781024 [Glomus cerebriforme]|uniref:Uncharacterized protein n=1 Tax=Glomus cerebriforme TaxID=658196 RepID=A0A397ST59_9GLOM|nr:hypothetical protein C1645_781024 [Glomus cerebriforme]
MEKSCLNKLGIVYHCWSYFFILLYKLFMCVYLYIYISFLNFEKLILACFDHVIYVASILMVNWFASGLDFGVKAWCYVCRPYLNLMIFSFTCLFFGSKDRVTDWG